MLKIIVLVSGGGTNLGAIIEGIESGRVKNTEIIGVISNNPGVYALERAKEHGIPGEVMSPKDYPDRDSFNMALTERITELAPDLIVAAGFMVRIPELLVERFPKGIINIHPSLIPSFCGKGYYGLRVHEAVLERGVKVTGATVHYVDNGIDTGPIIAQKPVYVLPEDTPEILQRRVMEEAEWIILPEAINSIAEEKM